MYTDTHCHLVSEKLRDHVPDLLNRATAAGVTRVINIAYDEQTTAAGYEIASRYPALWTTCGIQPHDASQYSRDLADRMALQARDTPRCVAIGEIGLDAHYTLSPMDIQERCFEHFLDIACELNKPVVVHVRETHRAVRDRMASRISRGLRGVIHCFTGTTDEARDFLDLGLYVSFSGIVTFKNASELASTAAFVPMDRLLIETDSPYLAPVPHRGRVNEPSFLPATAAFLARIKSCTPEQLGETTSTNASALFGLV